MSQKKYTDVYDEWSGDLYVCYRYACETYNYHTKQYVDWSYDNSFDNPDKQRSWALNILAMVIVFCIICPILMCFARVRK